MDKEKKTQFEKMKIESCQRSVTVWISLEQRWVS